MGFWFLLMLLGIVLLICIRYVYLYRHYTNEYDVLLKNITDAIRTGKTPQIVSTLPPALQGLVQAYSQYHHDITATIAEKASLLAQQQNEFSVQEDKLWQEIETLEDELQQIQDTLAKEQQQYKREISELTTTLTKKQQELRSTQQAADSFQQKNSQLQSQLEAYTTADEKNQAIVTDLQQKIIAIEQRYAQQQERSDIAEQQYQAIQQEQIVLQKALAEQEKQASIILSQTKKEVLRLHAKWQAALQDAMQLKSVHKANDEALAAAQHSLAQAVRLRDIAQEQYQALQSELQDANAELRDAKEIQKSQQHALHQSEVRIQELEAEIALLMEETEQALREKNQVQGLYQQLLQQHQQRPSLQNSSVTTNVLPELPTELLPQKVHIADIDTIVADITGATASVLVVDDSKTNLRVLSMMLQHEHFTILQAETGKDAIRTALEHTPDIILLDLILPDINGLEILDELRKHDSTKNIPVLLISSVGDTETKIEGFERGAVDYITKPFQQAEVVARLRSHMRISIMERALRRSVQELRQQYLLEEQRREQLSRINEELAKANDEAQEASKAKSAFLASMSHELRTPLNAIIGFAQILQRDNEIPARQRMYVETMYKSGNHLLEMINDVLDLSKIEAGHMTIIIETFDLRQFLADIEAMFTLRCKERSLYLRFSQAGNIPRFIESDPNKLRQVFINLIGNAVKFTPTGGITVTTERFVDDNGKEMLRFAVIDTGRGIPADQIDKILEPFRQVENKRMKSEGTGLGLTISKKVIEMLGGTLSITSEENVGSTFAFTVNLISGEEEELLNVDDNAEAEITGILNSEQYTVLIVDDSRTNRAIVREIMLPIGFHCIEAEDGAVALQMFKEHKPAIVLTDIVMPVMDGIESMKAMREYEQQFGLHTPIIALSASVLNSSRDALIADGFDDFLGKPFLLKDFYHVLAHTSNIQFITTSKEAEFTAAQQHKQNETTVTVFSVNEVANILKSSFAENINDIIDACETQDYHGLLTLLGNESKEPVLAADMHSFIAKKCDARDMIFFAKLAEELY